MLGRPAKRKFYHMLLLDAPKNVMMVNPELIQTPLNFGQTPPVNPTYCMNQQATMAARNCVVGLNLDMRTTVLAKLDAERVDLLSQRRGIIGQAPNLDFEKNGLHTVTHTDI